jgi:hypothetical protein
MRDVRTLRGMRNMMLLGLFVVALILMILLASFIGRRLARIVEQHYPEVEDDS